MTTTPATVIVADVMDGLATLAAGSVQCCVTSPPYWGLRDYGVAGQIGLEPAPEAYIERMVAVFREVWRVLRDDGTLWLNLGDGYVGGGRGGGGSFASERPGWRDTPMEFGKTRGIGNLKPKDLCMIPWRVALALQADGWYLRSVIVWAKKSPMPESVTDRPTSSWEPIFLFARQERYYYDAVAVKEPLTRGDAGSSYTSERKLAIHPNTGTNRMPPIGGLKHAGSNGNPTYSGNRPEWPVGRNQRNVWHMGPEPYPDAHFATFPTEIPRRAILAGTSGRGRCPECGTGWVRDGPVAWRQSCKCPAHEPVPCVVLDPFLGSGTTLAVARALGRHGIGIEINPQYADLARARIARAERPNTHRTTHAGVGETLFPATDPETPTCPSERSAPTPPPPETSPPSPRSGP